MKGLFLLTASAFFLGVPARAATFEESYETVRAEARQAYLRVEPVEQWVKPEQLLPLTDPSVPSKLEPGARRQQADELLAAVAAIQELQGKKGDEALPPAKKMLLVRTIKLGLRLDQRDHGLGLALYQPSRPGFPRPLADPERTAMMKSHLSASIERATSDAATLRAASDAAAAMPRTAGPPQAWMTREQLAALNAVPAAQGGVSTKIDAVPAPSLKDQAKLAALQTKAADARVREAFEREYAAEGHYLNDAQTSWDKAAGEATGPRSLLDKTVAFTIGLANDAQKSAVWWWRTRGNPELSPRAKDEATGQVALQAAMMIPIGRGVGVAAKVGEAALTAEAKAAATRAAQLEAKIAARQTLMREEASWLAEHSNGKADVVFHTTKAENLDKIRGIKAADRDTALTIDGGNTGRLAATTEKFAYGAGKEVTNVWRQLLSGVPPKDSLIVFQGDAAKLFRPHPVTGGYSAIKRAAGQRITDGSGDVIITNASYDPATRTLHVTGARMVQEGEERFALQKKFPMQPQVRHLGRVVLLDGALTGGVGFAALPVGVQRRLLECALGDGPCPLTAQR